MIILPEHEAIHAVLLNWARWLKTGHHPQRCKSIEGNYRPPPTWHGKEISNPPDILEAQRVEDLIVSEPKGYGRHLVYWYIKRLPAQAMSKKLVISPSNIDQHLNQSREWLKQNLA